MESDKGPSVVADAHMLADEVRRREATGEPPLSVSKGAREVFDGWGGKRGQKVTETAIQLGLLEPVNKEKGNGQVLKSPKSPEDRDFGMYNYVE